MSQFGATSKNPPWVRSGGQGIGMGVAQQGQLQQQMMGQAMGTMTNTTMLQYPQTQIFQQTQLGVGQLQQAAAAGMAMPAMSAMNTSQIAAGAMPLQPAALAAQPMYGQVGTVSYPTRALNTAAFGTAQANPVGNTTASANNANNNANVPKQRVFTGSVTKVQDNFGFVDEDVFFQTSCCVKGSNPVVGDKVLVEAVYNANMPFKWNATRIQVLPMGRNEPPASSGGRFSSNYNSVPPPVDNVSSSGSGSFGRRERVRDRRSRDDEEVERKKRREERREREEKEKEKEKERVKSPSTRKRSKSPRRPRRSRIVPRYMVQIPKIALDMSEADVLEIKRRYSNLYIPSDFFLSSFRWVDVFPADRPLTLERPCSFHVMHKDVDSVVENNASHDPPDADYLFSAKVLLLSMPDIDELFRKCCALAEDRDKEGSSGDEHGRDFVHPTRLINFLIGLRGKNETMAIGGPWSPSIDGPNPDKDASVLIKTAIRNCKALTGIDLSHCTQWYRFLEIYYRRSETMHKGKVVAARVETVVLYLPDVWNCLPTRLEWDGLHINYKKQLDRKLSRVDQEDDGEGDEKEGETGEIAKKEPTHYSELDPKTMKVSALKEELEARTLSPRGLKSQLIARLSKAIKTEADKAEEDNAKKEASKSSSKSEKEDKDDEKRKEEEKKKLDERDKNLMEKRYTLPDNPHIIVHPSRTAKSGKFDCTVMSLSLLLDYRQEDTKEHSFEVSLFAELFNEMLMRDFGFRIYRALVDAPEKPKEEKEDKDRRKEKDKKSSDKDKKDDKREKDKDEKRDRDKKSDDDEDDDDEYEEEDEDDSKDRKDSGKRKKKRERVKLCTEDPYLLLAFVYFDQTHCGYIFDKDIEELLFTLGLNLSRAQVKKLVQKVVTRDSLHYRKLTDKPKESNNSEGAAAKQNGVKSKEDLSVLARGNKRLLPVFSAESDVPPIKRIKKEKDELKEEGEEEDEAPCLESGFVMYNGSLVDVSKLMSQLKRSEDARLDTEKHLAKLRSENSQLKELSNRTEAKVKDLSSELKDFKERLTNTNSELCSVDAKTKLYYTTLQEIYDKVGPLLTRRDEKDDEEHTIETVEMEDVQQESSEINKLDSKHNSGHQEKNAKKEAKVERHTDDLNKTVTSESSGVMKKESSSSNSNKHEKN